MSVSLGGWCDGLSVVESLCASARVEACRHPTVKPGPCPGSKRGTTKKLVAPKAIKDLREPRARKAPAKTKKTTPDQPSGDTKTSPEQSPGTPAPPRPMPGGGKPRIGGLIREPNGAPPEESAALVAAFGRGMNGTFGGLEVRVESAVQSDNQTKIKARIYDADGKPMGVTERTFHRGNGDNDPDTLWVSHDILELEKEAQGAGFSKEWFTHLEDWYRDSGLSHVRLDANKDIGGYAWARWGADFADRAAAQKVQDRISGIYEALKFDLDFNDPNTERGRFLLQQVEAGAKLMKQYADNPYGTPGYPTPYQISKAGRQPGQGRTVSWFGKLGLLGSRWDALKWL